MPILLTPSTIPLQIPFTQSIPVFFVPSSFVRYFWKYPVISFQISDTIVAIKLTAAPIAVPSNLKKDCAREAKSIPAIQSLVFCHSACAAPLQSIPAIHSCISLKAPRRKSPKLFPTSFQFRPPSAPLRKSRPAVNPRTSNRPTKVKSISLNAELRNSAT